ncbi:unnamed protein product [Adineta ricciae]|uniref:Uncharacterized protein n=1 Tax=Adineta ricciae TaxID=249248 RepID=A0A814G8D2_ADIRI|nr:unnamed protein product [Adineta ricciae]
MSGHDCSSLDPNDKKHNRSLLQSFSLTNNNDKTSRLFKTRENTRSFHSLISAHCRQRINKRIGTQVTLTSVYIKAVNISTPSCSCYSKPREKDNECCHLFYRLTFEQ